jgi:hypothetical protein
MTDQKIEKKVQQINHSFEKALGVPCGTTEVVKTKIKSIAIKSEDYDLKDEEIEEDFLNIYDKSLELYELLLDEIDDAEQNKVSRLAEVAAIMLNTALSSAEKRRIMKQHIDTLQQKERLLESSGKNPKGNINNVFVGTFQELMKYLNKDDNLDKNDKSVIESVDYDKDSSE